MVVEGDLVDGEADVAVEEGGEVRAIPPQGEREGYLVAAGAGGELVPPGREDGADARIARADGEDRRFRERVLRGEAGGAVAGDLGAEEGRALIDDLEGYEAVWILTDGSQVKSAGFEGIEVK